MGFFTIPKRDINRKRVKTVEHASVAAVTARTRGPREAWSVAIVCAWLLLSMVVSSPLSHTKIKAQWPIILFPSLYCFYRGRGGRGTRSSGHSILFTLSFASKVRLGDPAERWVELRGAGVRCGCGRRQVFRPLVGRTPDLPPVLVEYEGPGSPRAISWVLGRRLTWAMAIGDGCKTRRRLDVTGKRSETNPALLGIAAEPSSLRSSRHRF